MERRGRDSISQGIIDLSSKFIDESTLAGGHKLVVGSVWPTEGELLSSLTEKYAGTVVEIGSWIGVSTLYLVKGLLQADRGHVYSIDPHTNSTLHKRRGVEDTEGFLRDNLLRAGVDDWVTVYRKTSSEALSDWVHGPVDVLYIDGDHRYKSVAIDYCGWLPYLRQGSIVIFHDSDAAGVKRVIREYVKSDDKLCELKGIRRVKVFQRRI